MSRTALVVTSFLLNLLFAIKTNHALNVRPPECAGFPSGCTCSTHNFSTGGGDHNGVFVITITCNGIGLTEVPDFSNHTMVANM